MDRRRFVNTNVAALGLLSVSKLSPVEALINNKTVGSGRFIHRGYLGWITDLATNPDTNADWPSMRIDTQLLQDYHETFGLMKETGFNEIVIWGLYVSRNWPVEIEQVVSPERGAMIETLLADAHKHGIKVLSGLGVYSWGFEELIRSYPELSRGSSQLMCASEPRAWEWMKRVIDYTMTRFPIDGVSMQSADLGRCQCSQCGQYSDAEYHALLNVRVAEYIRSRWSNTIIGVNSWGMKFQDAATLHSLKQMSETVDYIIDVNDSSRKINNDHRRNVIQSIQCGFGTLGGPQVEPPQHWERNRWFLPTLRTEGEHIQELGNDGGRACEYFFHILANPGDELSFRLAGKCLSDTKTSWQDHLRVVVEEAFGIRNSAANKSIAELSLRAEDAYFKHLSPKLCGTISMEPLVSNQGGKPIYLSERLSKDQMAQYRTALSDIKKGFKRLSNEYADNAKLKKVIECIDNTIHDIDFCLNE